MFVVFVVVAAVVLFAVVVVATGRGDVLDTDDARASSVVLPEGTLGAADLDGLRFTVVARGYRMDQVDEVLDRLGRELDVRARRIAELEAQTTATAATRRFSPAGVSQPPLPRRRPGGGEADPGH